jgi:hypothetical protein
LAETLVQADSRSLDAVRLSHAVNRFSALTGTASMAQLSPSELVALIAGQLVASRGDSSAPVISEAVEAAVRIVDAADAAVAARHSRGR